MFKSMLNHFIFLGKYNMKIIIYGIINAETNLHLLIIIQYLHHNQLLIHQLKPTIDPSTSPTLKPTFDPSVSPIEKPTKTPTTFPSLNPTKFPSLNPTKFPSQNPTKFRSENPTKFP
eukprot:85837_1